MSAVPTLLYFAREIVRRGPAPRAGRCVLCRLPYVRGAPMSMLYTAHSFGRVFHCAWHAGRCPALRLIVGGKP